MNAFIPVPTPHRRPLAALPAGVFALAACLLLTGCTTDPASSLLSAGQPTVTAESLAATSPSRPRMVYVSDFYLDPNSIQKESIVPRPGLIRGRLDELRGEDPASKAHRLIRELSESIVEGLKEGGLPAEVLHNRNGLRRDFIPADAPLPTNGWIVSGWFYRVDEGNRALQSTVGFGEGAASVEIEVLVSDLARDVREPFLVLGSESGKNLRPGGLIFRNPYAMAAKYVLSRGATSKDVRRQGKAIAQSLIDYVRQAPAP